MRKALLLSVLSLIAVQVCAADNASVQVSSSRNDAGYPRRATRGSMPLAVAPPRASMSRYLTYPMPDKLRSLRLPKR